jgi:hypothetical protein
MRVVLGGGESDSPSRQAKRKDWRVAVMNSMKVVCIANIIQGVDFQFKKKIFFLDYHYESTT